MSGAAGTLDQILDVIDGRSRQVLGKWLTEAGNDWCERIRLATLDPAAEYRLALVDNLPNATLAVDHFHCVKLANQAIDDVRRRPSDRCRHPIGRGSPSIGCSLTAVEDGWQGS